MARQTARQMTPRRILRLLDAGSPDGGYRFLSSTEGSRWFLRPTDGGPFRKVDPAAASFNATALSAVSQRRRGTVMAAETHSGLEKTRYGFVIRIKRFSKDAKISEPRK